MNNQTIETLTMEEIRSRLSVHVAEHDMPITEDGFTMLYNIMVETPLAWPLWPIVLIACLVFVSGY